MVHLVPLRLVLIPVTHQLIQSSAVEKAIRATDVIGEMAREDRTGWAELQVARRPINISIERLHHPENEPGHNALLTIFAMIRCRKTASRRSERFTQRRGAL